MPGDDWQKFANLRLLFVYMYTHPGKKLLIAGSELGSWNEWSHESTLEKHLLNYDSHRQISQFVQDLCTIYNTNSALWEWDCRPEGFSWIDCNDNVNSVLSYIRRSHDKYLICLLNFTPVVRQNYRIGVPEMASYKEILNSDSEYYGGGNVGNAVLVEAKRGRHHGYEQFLELTLPPLAGLILTKTGE